MSKHREETCRRSNVDKVDIILVDHAWERTIERAPGGLGLRKGRYVRLIGMRRPGTTKIRFWVLQAGGGLLLGKLAAGSTGHLYFRTMTFLEEWQFRRTQRTSGMLPAEVCLARVWRIHRDVGAGIEGEGRSEGEMDPGDPDL